MCRQTPRQFRRRANARPGPKKPVPQADVRRAAHRPEHKPATGLARLVPPLESPGHRRPMAMRFSLDRGTVRHANNTRRPIPEPSSGIDFDVELGSEVLHGVFTWIFGSAFRKTCAPTADEDSVGNVAGH